MIISWKNICVSPSYNDCNIPALIHFTVKKTGNNVPRMMFHGFPTSPNVCGNPASSSTYLEKNSIWRTVQVRRLKYLWCDGVYLHEGWSPSVIRRRTPSKHREFQWGSDADQLIPPPHHVTLERVTPYSCKQVTCEKLWGWTGSWNFLRN